ncbi:hypothetical protein [Nocardia brasiliensis]|uniref:hypothetical protein n=1 Tax=Nocardia brasiliensis TaxID=37326 RepID=UPI00245522F4|nr:hypothetical protein [Nocardia brasiliensis]
MATLYATLEVIPTVRGISARTARQISGPLTAAGHKAGRDAGDAIVSGIEAKSYEATGASVAARIRAGFNSGIAGIGAGFSVATKAAGLFVANASTIATAMGLASKVVRSFSAATFISALALRQVASTGLTRLAGALRIIAAIAGRVAREIGQVTAAFLVLQGVVRVASFMTNFAKRLAMMTVGTATAIGVVSGLGTLISGPLISALGVGAVALGAFAGAAVGLGGPAFLALKVGLKGLSDAAGTFTEQFKDADDAFNKMVGQRMGPMLTAVRSLRQEMVGAFSKELAKEFVTGAGSAFSRIGALADNLRPKMGLLSAVVAQIGYEITASLTGPAAAGAFRNLTDASVNFFQHLNAGENGLGSLASGLVQFASTAATTFQDSSARVNEFALNLGNKLTSITPDQIRNSFAQLRQVFENIGNVAGPLFSLFRQMGQISATALAPGFAAIGRAVRDATPGLLNMANIVMPAIGEVMQRLAPLIPALVQAFTPWATVLATIAPPLATVVAHMAPLAPYLLMAATAFRVAGAVMLVWNATMFAASVAQGVFAAATGRSAATLTGNTIALAAHRIALIAGAVAARAFGAAMAVATGPIGLIVLAVAAVGVALWAFFTKTETGKKWWAAIWNGIKVAVSATWEFLKVAWQGILTGIQWIGDKANWLWNNVFQPVFGFIGSLISSWWTGVVQPAFNGVKTAFEVVGNVISWWWNSIVTPAFTAAGATISYFWDKVGSPIFNNIKVAVSALGAVISWWWTSVAVPAFQGVGAVISWLWDTVGSPMFENFKAGIGLVGSAISFFKDNVVDPVFKGIGTAIDFAWKNVVSPTFDNMKKGIGLVGDAFGAAGGVVKTIWSNVADTLRPAVHFLGNILAKVPSKIGPIEIPGAGMAQDLGKAMQSFSSGGLAIGPGTGTSDDILARISNGEYIEPAARVTPQTLPVLDAIRSGWVPSPEFLHAMVPGFAGGGLVEVQQWARGEAGKSYQYGGTGNPGWDCSGIAGGLYAKATGKTPNARYFTTDSDFAALGWKPGLGGATDLSIGTNGATGTAGHMASTLGDLNIEASGSDGVEVGAGAQGAADFPKRWHIPIGGNPLGTGAGGANSNGTGGLGSGNGSGTGGTGTSGGTNSSGNAARPSGTAVPVWVDNWPSSLSSSSSAASTAAADTTTAPASASVNPTGDNTDTKFDQAAAITAAFAKFNASMSGAASEFGKGQGSAVPGIGGYVDGIEKTVNNWNVVVADVAEAFNRITREQKRQTAGK